jgi:signal transduction histidine kinase
MISLSGKSVRINIADTGADIPADKLDIVFEPFVQLGSTASNRTGLGLDLDIARTLVLTRHGSVEADSDGPDRGASFTVTLPIAPLEALTLEHRRT